MALPEDAIGFIIGKEGRAINELRDKSGVIDIKIRDTSARIFGSKGAVEKAKLLLEAHVAFLEQAEFEKAEAERVRREAEQLSTRWVRGEDPPCPSTRTRRPAPPARVRPLLWFSALFSQRGGVYVT